MKESVWDAARRATPRDAATSSMETSLPSTCVSWRHAARCKDYMAARVAKERRRSPELGDSAPAVSSCVVDVDRVSRIGQCTGYQPDVSCRYVVCTPAIAAALEADGHATNLRYDSRSRSIAPITRVRLYKQVIIYPCRRYFSDLLQQKEPSS